MALKWVNIRTGEKLIAETEPQISALWGSSNRHPNVMQGQDFGWRLAPEVEVELDRIKGDMDMLDRIARRFGKMVEDLREGDILTYLSNRTRLEAAPEPDLNQFQSDYDAEVRKLKAEGSAVPHNLFGDDEETAPVNLATLSDEELAAELARRKAAAGGNTTTTTKSESTTTTTTKAPEGNS